MNPSSLAACGMRVTCDLGLARRGVPWSSAGMQRRRRSASTHRLHRRRAAQIRPPTASFSLDPAAYNVRASRCPSPTRAARDMGSSTNKYTVYAPLVFPLVHRSALFRFISSSSSAMSTIGAGATATERRLRAYDILDSIYPGRGYALRWCNQAQEMYKADGDMKDARLLLRSALRCKRVTDYASVYKAWIAKELHEGNVDAARGLFLEWGHRLYAGDGEDSGVDFWCMFINFEVKNGAADFARAVAKAAVEACPTDPTVYAKNLKVELLFGHRDRPSHDVLGRHLDNFAMDVDCKDWLVHYQVGACYDHDDYNAKRHGGGFFFGTMCRGVRRLVQPHGYRPLHEASTTTSMFV